MCYLFIFKSNEEQKECTRDKELGCDFLLYYGTEPHSKSIECRWSRGPVPMKSMSAAESVSIGVASKAAATGDTTYDVPHEIFSHIHMIMMWHRCGAVHSSTYVPVRTRRVMYCTTGIYVVANKKMRKRMFNVVCGKQEDAQANVQCCVW